jgi:hypothetical protein
MKAVQSAVFEDLPGIERVEPWRESDQVLFDELHAVLEKHRAASRFGITLLHKHFPVFENEVLVESCDHETRTLTTRPRPKSGVSARVIETNWRFDVPGILSQVCYTLCEDEDGGHASVHQAYDNSDDS